MGYSHGNGNGNGREVRGGCLPSAILNAALEHSRIRTHLELAVGFVCSRRGCRHEEIQSDDRHTIHCSARYSADFRFATQTIQMVPNRNKEGKIK